MLHYNERLPRTNDDEQEADIERRMNKAAEDASLIVAWDDETGEPIFAGEGDQIGLRRLIETLFTRIEAWNCRKDGAARWERHVQMHDDPPRIICQTLLRQ
jgi:hypothetical protein